MSKIFTLWFSLIIISIYVSSCAPIPDIQTTNPTSIHRPSTPAVTLTITGPKKSPSTSPTHPVYSPKAVSKTLSNIQFQGVSFDSRAHALKTIDQAKGPGSQYSSARDCATKQQALLAINAGFFTPEGDPLGLVISQGKRSGSWNSSSSLGTGIYHINPSGNASISRRTQASVVSNSTELLQAGPLLIEHTKPISGLNKTKVAMRSILLHDGANRWWIGITSPCSLADLSLALSNQSPAGWKVSHALNLDGGRSTDLFVSSKISGGSLERKSLMNRQVRNFLILKSQ
jgi:hypothetical protein